MKYKSQAEIVQQHRQQARDRYYSIKEEIAGDASKRDKFVEEEMDQISPNGIEFTGALAEVWWYGAYSGMLLSELPLDYLITFYRENSKLKTLQVYRAKAELERRAKLLK